MCNGCILVFIPPNGGFMKKLNRNPGFYAGRNAFKLLSEFAPSNTLVKPGLMIYNGFEINLDNHIGKSEVIGVGEPYASIAKEMEKEINGVEL